MPAANSKQTKSKRCCTKQVYSPSLGTEQKDSRIKNTRLTHVSHSSKIKRKQNAPCSRVPAANSKTKPKANDVKLKLNKCIVLLSGLSKKIAKLKHASNAQLKNKEKTKPAKGIKKANKYL